MPRRQQGTALPRIWVSKLESCVHREPELAKELNERWAETTGLRLVPEEASRVVHEPKTPKDAAGKEGRALASRPPTVRERVKQSSENPAKQNGAVGSALLCAKGLRNKPFFVEKLEVELRTALMRMLSKAWVRSS